MHENFARAFIRTDSTLESHEIQTVNQSRMSVFHWLSCVLILVLLQSCHTARIGIITCPDKSHTFTFTKVAMELIGAGHEVYYCIRDHDYENATAGPGINYKIIENWFTRTERQQLREHLTTLDIVSAELEDTDWMFKDYNFFLNSSCVNYLKEKQIDLFLFDPLYIANYLILQQLNVSSLAISTNSLYDPILSYVYGTSNSLSEIPQMSLGRDNKLSLYGRMVNIFTWALDYAYLKYYFYKLERLAFAHGLLPFSDPHSHFGRQILLLPLQTGRSCYLLWLLTVFFNYFFSYFFFTCEDSTIHVSLPRM